MKPFSLDDFMVESNRIEGIEETTPEQVAATARFLSRKELTISDIVDLVAVYQPNARPRFVAGLNVRVGDHVPMRGGPNVQKAMQAILDVVNCGFHSGHIAHESHVNYEYVHPFTDGNGRSGRALWLWVMGGINKAPLGFLHHFYYQTLQRVKV